MPLKAVLVRLEQEGGAPLPAKRFFGYTTELAGKRLVDGKGFEPSTPTLRTWCSPS